MTVEFDCRCGKKLRAAKQHAGKRAKCNQCGEVVTIPGTPQVTINTVAKQAATPVAATSVQKPLQVAAPQTDLGDLLAGEHFAAKSAAPKSCPECSNMVSNAAVVCLKCGFNFKTGEKRNTSAYSYASPKSTEKAKPRRPSFLSRFVTSRLHSAKFMSGLAMMIGAVVWFVVGWHLGVIFIYPPILFILGFLSFIAGLIDGSD
jgi:hypothetical protein